MPCSGDRAAAWLAGRSPMVGRAASAATAPVGGSWDRGAGPRRARLPRKFYRIVITSFARLLPYARRYRRGIAAGLILVILSNAAGVLAPWLLGRAIDAIEQPGVTASLLGVFAFAIVGVALVSGAARFGMRQLLNGISRRIETDLRDDLFAHLVRLDAGFYGRTRTGDLMSRATNDTQAVRMAIGPAVMYLVNTLAMTVFALTLMARSNARLTLVALLPLALLPPVMLRFGRVIHHRFQRIQEQFGTLSTMVQENLAGVRIVRAYGQQDAQASEFAELNADYLERNMALARTSAVFRPLLTLLAGLGTLVVLGYGGLEVIRGAVTPGEFVAFFFYLGLLAWPMISLGWVINLFQRGAASMARIEEVMGTRPAIGEPSDPPRVTGPVRGEIEFRNVSFRYPGTERMVLRDLSFRIAAGETVAIVGPTGAGKSTVIALLTRRYDPTSGTVLLDGLPLAGQPLERLRAAMGVVPQDAFVFSDTIRRNIAFGGAEAAAEDRLAAVRAQPTESDAPTAEPPASRVEWAADVARLSETIREFPAGFDTLLGERGVNLSGGQRQRTTLARALVRDPRILVLDDALSAVDTHTETEILAGLRHVLRGRTAVIVSHRITAVKDADRVLVLEDGRLVEQGRHLPLIAHGGLYSALLRRQMLEEALAGDAAENGGDGSGGLPAGPDASTIPG